MAQQIISEFLLVVTSKYWIKVTCLVPVRRPLKEPESFPTSRRKEFPFSTINLNYWKTFKFRLIEIF